MQHLTSIEQISTTQLEKINDFLSKNKRVIFSKAYITSLESDDFANEVKNFEDFIYRGKFIPAPNKENCNFSKKAKFAINLTSCTSNYTRTEALLLDEDLEPIVVCMTSPTCSIG